MQVYKFTCTFQMKIIITRNQRWIERKIHLLSINRLNSLIVCFYLFNSLRSINIKVQCMFWWRYENNRHYNVSEWIWNLTDFFLFDFSFLNSLNQIKFEKKEHLHIKNKSKCCDLGSQSIDFEWYWIFSLIKNFCDYAIENTSAQNWLFFHLKTKRLLFEQ